MQPGERIRKFREESGYVQIEFAWRLKISPGYLAQIELGIRLPSREFLKKLYKVFGISSDYILYGVPADQTEIELPCRQVEYSEPEKKVMTFGEKERRYQILPTSIKKLLDNVVEILESDNEVMADLLKTNIKGILESVRISQKTDENKSKGGD